jgi:HAD superfamily hydrolase (TIGR01490 family)
MKRPVAFFDIDGTVFRSSLLIEIVETMVEENFFPATAIQEYRKEYEAWRNREGTYEAYIDAVVKSFLKHIKGVYYGDFADIGRMIVAEHGKQVYRYTRDLIENLKADNYYLVAISQSPKTILDEFCENYGFDKVYGRIYEIGPHDNFTGVIVGEEYIKNKANIVERVLQLEDVTSAESIGVGDTESDIPLLECVEQPICFNPNKRLYDYAKQKGWEIVVERKDVIYEL